jgi:F-box domain
MDQASKPHRECHILDVPNEVLQMIFSSIPLQEIVHYHDDTGKEKSVSQILILMSTCRRFREACYEIGFWLEPDFTFSSLLPQTDDSQLQVLREWSLITALLNDENIVRSFAQRSLWAFETAESMLLIIINIGLVYQNIQTIALDQLAEVDFALRKLQWLHHLTDLIIVCTSNPIDLDAIAKCRSLKRLGILEFQSVYECKGTLEHTTLHRLSIAYLRDRHSLDNQFQIKLVAVDSASTITTLEVLNCSRISRRVQEFEPLKRFVNLTQIEMLPLCEDFCELITTASCRLTTFAVMFELYHGDHLLDKYVDMLAAPSLSQLETLYIYFVSRTPDVSFEKYIPLCTIILDAVVSHQQSLQYLELHSNIEISWCSHFLRLKNLESLEWIIPIDLFYSTAIINREIWRNTNNGSMNSDR